MTNTLRTLKNLHDQMLKSNPRPTVLQLRPLRSELLPINELHPADLAQTTPSHLKPPWQAVKDKIFNVEDDLVRSALKQAATA
jgi:hypothetical protein